MNVCGGLLTTEKGRRNRAHVLRVTGFSGEEEAVGRKGLRKSFMVLVLSTQCGETVGASDQRVEFPVGDMSSDGRREVWEQRPKALQRLGDDLRVTKRPGGV